MINIYQISIGGSAERLLSCQHGRRDEDASQNHVTEVVVVAKPMTSHAEPKRHHSREIHDREPTTLAFDSLAICERAFTFERKSIRWKKSNWKWIMTTKSKWTFHAAQKWRLQSMDNIQINFSFTIPIYHGKVKDHKKIFLSIIIMMFCCLCLSWLPAGNRKR